MVSSHICLDNNSICSNKPTRVEYAQNLTPDNIKAIRKLPPKQQEIFKLRYCEDLPLNEIAERLGRSIGTVKAHLFHAHRNLRKHLRHYLQEDDF